MCEKPEFETPTTGGPKAGSLHNAWGVILVPSFYPLLHEPRVSETYEKKAAVILDLPILAGRSNGSH